MISISYNNAEYDLPVNYLRRQCSDFMKLGMAGTTVVVSSGDYGSAWRQFSTSPPNSYYNYDNTCVGEFATTFVPTMLSSCPYVTSVGATQVTQGSNFTVQEVAAFQEIDVNLTFSSGGGFSNIFTTPDYQASAVNGYFATAGA